MRSLPRRSILPLALLALTSCEEGGATYEDSAICGSVPITITISTLPFTLESPGTLADGDCYLARQAYGDRYKIELLLDAHVDLTVASDDFNAFMYLRDVGDHEVSADNDAGDGTDAFIGLDLENADSYVFYVFATSYPKDRTGAYTFTISATAP